MCIRDRSQRLSGVLLLLGEPASLRFEALSPFGTPVLIVAGDPQSVTLWEVLDDRAYIAPASPDANRRWLGVALGGEDLVALLAGRVRALADPASVEDDLQLRSEARKVRRVDGGLDLRATYPRVPTHTRRI